MTDTPLFKPSLRRSRETSLDLTPGFRNILTLPGAPAAPAPRFTESVTPRSSGSSASRSGGAQGIRERTLQAERERAATMLQARGDLEASLILRTPLARRQPVTPAEIALRERRIQAEARRDETIIGASSIRARLALQGRQSQATPQELRERAAQASLGDTFQQRAIARYGSDADPGFLRREAERLRREDDIFRTQRTPIGSREQRAVQISRFFDPARPDTPFTGIGREAGFTNYARGTLESISQTFAGRSSGIGEDALNIATVALPASGLARSAAVRTATRVPPITRFFSRAPGAQRISAGLGTAFGRTTVLTLAPGARQALFSPALQQAPKALPFLPRIGAGLSQAGRGYAEFATSTQGIITNIGAGALLPSTGREVFKRTRPDIFFNPDTQEVLRDARQIERERLGQLGLVRRFAVDLPGGEFFRQEAFGSTVFDTAQRRGISEFEARAIANAARRERAIGGGLEIFTALGTSATAEIVGSRIFSRITPIGGRATTGATFGRGFISSGFASGLEGATTFTGQALARGETDEFLRRLGFTTLGGGLFGGAIGGGIAGLSTRQATTPLARIGLFGVRVADPFEFPGDVLGSAALRSAGRSQVGVRMGARAQGVRGLFTQDAGVFVNIQPQANINNARLSNDIRDAFRGVRDSTRNNARSTPRFNLQGIFGFTTQSPGARVDPRIDFRPDPRIDPRVDTRTDPRVDTRTDPRVDTRTDPRVDPRIQALPTTSGLPRIPPFLFPPIGGGISGGFGAGDGSRNIRRFFNEAQQGLDVFQQLTISPVRRKTTSKKTSRRTRR